VFVREGVGLNSGEDSGVIVGVDDGSVISVGLCDKSGVWLGGEVGEDVLVLLFSAVSEGTGDLDIPGGGSS
jgi:hypothetical protein